MSHSASTATMLLDVMKTPGARDFKLTGARFITWRPSSGMDVMMLHLEMMALC